MVTPAQQPPTTLPHDFRLPSPALSPSPSPATSGELKASSENFHPPPNEMSTCSKTEEVPRLPIGNTESADFVTNTAKSTSGENLHQPDRNLQSPHSETTMKKQRKGEYSYSFTFNPTVPDSNSSASALHWKKVNTGLVKNRSSCYQKQQSPSANQSPLPKKDRIQPKLSVMRQSPSVDQLVDFVASPKPEKEFMGESNIAENNDSATNMAYVPTENSKVARVSATTCPSSIADTKRADASETDKNVPSPGRINNVQKEQLSSSRQSAVANSSINDKLVNSDGKVMCPAQDEGGACGAPWRRSEKRSTALSPTLNLLTISGLKTFEI